MKCFKLIRRRNNRDLMIWHFNMISNDYILLLIVQLYHTVVNVNWRIFMWDKTVMFLFKGQAKYTAVPCTFHTQLCKVPINEEGIVYFHIACFYWRKSNASLGVHGQYVYAKQHSTPVHMDGDWTIDSFVLQARPYYVCLALSDNFLTFHAR